MQTPLEMYGYATFRRRSPTRPARCYCQKHRKEGHTDHSVSVENECRTCSCMILINEKGVLCDYN